MLTVGVALLVLLLVACTAVDPTARTQRATPEPAGEVASARRAVAPPVERPAVSADKRRVAVRFGTIAECEAACVLPATCIATRAAALCGTACSDSSDCIDDELCTCVAADARDCAQADRKKFRLCIDGERSPCTRHQLVVIAPRPSAAAVITAMNDLGYTCAAQAGESGDFTCRTREIERASVCRQESRTVRGVLAAQGLPVTVRCETQDFCRFAPFTFVDPSR
jgi:hypothetical protein